MTAPRVGIRTKFHMRLPCRAVRVVVIPDKKSCLLKIITVMWVDEKETKSGTILGAEDE
jgi:hypothetical protein